MKSFAELSTGVSGNFLLRWRGRQEGPYPASFIEAKLGANEIGLLHEIFHDGQWITIRDYITVREAVLRAENQKREEQEHQAREAAERQAKEQEEQRRAVLLAEERRSSAQLESVQPPQGSDQHVYQHIPVNKRPSSGSRTFGVILLIVGTAVTGYFFLAFDTSVESGLGRVNNLGLMADRQGGIIIGIGLGVVGAIMLAIGSRGKD